MIIQYIQFPSYASLNINSTDLFLSLWSTEYKIVGSSLPRTTSARPLTNCLLEIGCLLATQLA